MRRLPTSRLLLVDMTDRAGPAVVVETAVARYGRLDGAFNALSPARARTSRVRAALGA